MIIFGWRLYGKSNLIVRHDVCELCGKPARLETYDAAKFFHLYFIPLIPLGRKHVIDQCSKCGKGRQLPLRQFRRLRDEALSESRRKANANLQDGAVAIDALHTMIAFLARDEFHAEAPGLAKRHPSNSDVQRTIGEGFTYFSEHEKATPFYEAAAKLNGSTENRFALSDNLIRLQKVRDAEPWLEPVIDAGGEDGLLACDALADAYQSIGRKEDALRLLETKERYDRDAASDPEHEARKKAVAPAAEPLSELAGTAEKSPAPPSLFNRFIVLALVIGLPGLYLGISKYYAWHKKAWLVNGTSSPYEVSVNGEKYALKPHQRKAIEIVEGDIVMRIEGTAMPVADRKGRFTSFILWRLFDNRTLVLNPDQCAVLMEQVLVYSAPENPVPSPKPTWVSGKAVYEFEDIDYAFSPSPNQLNLKSKSAVKKKRRLSLYVPRTPTDVYYTLTGMVDPSETDVYVQNWLRFQPDDPFAISIFLATCDPQSNPSSISFFDQALALRPIHIEWHRAYQELIDTTDPDHDLEGEYRKLKSEEPSDRAAAYLLGRVLPDPEKSLRLFEEAESGDRPIGYGHNGMAYHYLCSGNFEKAVHHSASAVAIDGRSTVFEQTHLDALLAAGEYKRIATYVSARLGNRAGNTSLLVFDIKALLLAGKAAEADQKRIRFLRDYKKSHSSEEALEMRKAIDVLMSYPLEDDAAYLEKLEKVSPELAELNAALIGLDCIAAKEIQERENVGSEDDLILVYAIARHVGRDDLFDSLITQIQGAYVKGNSENRLIARMFGGESDLVAKQLKTLGIHPQRKRVIATGLGKRYPELKDLCFAIAATHNYDPEFPKRLLERLMSK